MAKSKKIISKKSAKKDALFAPLPDSTSVRINLLETRKSILESLKVFSEIKNIRKSKNEEKLKLTKQLSQIALIIGKIKVSLPTINLPSDEPKSQPQKRIVEFSQSKSEKPVQPESIIQKQPTNELDSIEKELAEIESKLNSLH